MLEIDTRLIPERFQKATFFSKIGLFSSIGIGALNIIITFVTWNVTDENTIVLVSTIASIVGILNIGLTIVIMVFIARALNNLAHFFQTKYGKDNMESSLAGAPLWAPFITIIAWFIIPKVVTPKPHINETISSQKKTLQKVFLNFFAAGVASSLVNNADTFIFPILGQAMVAAAYILAYFRGKQYFAFVDNQILANPTEYGINGYAQPQANPYAAPTQPQVNAYAAPTQPQVNAYAAPTQPQVNAYAAPTQQVPPVPQVNPYSQPEQPQEPQTLPVENYAPPQPVMEQPTYSQPVIPPQPQAQRLPETVAEVPAPVEPTIPQVPQAPAQPTLPVAPTPPPSQLPPAPKMRGLPPAPFHKP